jgi:hypothetical protein
MSLTEIASELGCSLQAVQQCEKSALRKARRLLNSRGMTVRDFFSAMSIGHHDIGHKRKSMGRAHD